jgi:hypothetical protein
LLALETNAILQLTSSFVSSGLANFGSRPATVGKKKGAALGTFGGCFGLFLA